MDVQWCNYTFREPHDIPTKIVDISARGLIMENPIDFGPEDDLLEDSTVGVFPHLNIFIAFPHLNINHGSHVSLILTFRNWIG